MIHQLIRSEYPHLRTFGRDKCIVIKKRNELHEAADLSKKKAASNERIKRQVGFRIIVDALSGLNLDGFDLMRFAKDPITGDSINFDRQNLASRFHRAGHALLHRRPVLVGHNMFLDLVYFYRAFIGALPESVTEFTALIHAIFPMIVDTKYLATHGSGNINPSSSLAEIEEELRSQSKPKICVHKNHTRYNARETFHEAGFDSYLTAKIMILLSTKLEISGTWIEDGAPDSEAESYHTAMDPHSDAPEEPEHSSKSHFNSALRTRREEAKSPKTNKLASAQEALEDFVITPLVKEKTRRNKKKSKSKREKNTSPFTARFAHNNAFSCLADGGSQSSSASEAEDSISKTFERPLSDTEDAQPTTKNGANEARHNDKLLNPGAMPFFAPTRNGRQAVDASEAHDRPQDRRNGETGELKPLMPPFNLDFWRVYGNKLRIFGTVETLLDLDPAQTGFSARS